MNSIRILFRAPAYAIAAFGVCAASATAQTAPGTAVPPDPFEVHGLLYSGSAPAGYLLGDGWAQGAEFLGVLDENGQPTMNTQGAPFRAARMVDPNWGNSGDASDPTLFGGGNKNYDLIGLGQSPWEWGGGGGGPQKNDITNTYFHTRVDPLTGDRWVFVGAETRSTNGDSHVDFEFNQAGVVKVGSTGGTLVGMGPDGGRTINDFLINVDFVQGGEQPVATVRVWDGVEFVEVSANGAIFSAANLVDVPHGALGTWRHFTSDGAMTNVLTALQFVEGAANLTALGIQVDPCMTSATFMAKTRSSSSWDSDLKDFALVHFPLEATPELQAFAPQSVCGSASFSASVKDLTGLANTDLLWQATGCGRITSDATAASVTVQADAACDCQIVLSVSASGGECQHVGTTEIMVEVNDVTEPVLSAQPGSATVECDAIPAAAVVTATDDCTNPPVDFQETPTPGLCLGDSSIERTWTAVDNCQNTASHTQVLTVEDSTAPVLAGVPADASVSCDAVPEPAQVTATDNCSMPAVELIETDAPGSCLGSAVITRTWTATDACGNASMHTQTLAVSDNAPPEMTNVPTPATYECDALPDPPLISATDNCSAADVNLIEATEPGLCLGEAIVTRTWTATDECGNAREAAQIISLVDTTRPALIGVPADATVECDSIPDPPVVTATDNCSEPTIEMVEEIEGAIAVGQGIITRIWTATDACGNSTSAMQVITVIDTTRPALHGVPSDATVECDSIPDPPEVTATDNCASPPVDYNETREDGECDGEITIRRTWKAVDDAGNTITRTQVITVIDSSLPEWVEVPGNLTAECDDVPPPANVSAADNCSTATVELTEVSQPGECAHESVITRTWTATDDCGNSLSHSQVITVVDTTAPVLSDAPADLVAECDAVPPSKTLTATDNCDNTVPVTRDDETTPGSCGGNYDVLRTWSAADDCDNEAAVDQLVEVRDTTAPTLRLEPNRTQFICDGRPVTYRLSASDNCVAAQMTGGGIITITANNRDQVVVGPLPASSVIIQVPGPAWIQGSFTASDACGNVSQPFEFTVGTRLGREACSQGFWRNHYDLWGPTGFSPSDPFLAAFQITDLSSPEIPSGFDHNITLGEAGNMTGGSFNQALLQGVAALLNAGHPDVEFPATVEQIRAAMQAAFAGEMTFDQARVLFTSTNAVESECGCPVQ